VREEIKRLKYLNRNVSAAHKDQQGVRKLIYHNVHLSLIRVDRKKCLQVVAEFDQSSQIKNKFMKQRED
jgi:hypothetical protein